MSPNNHSFAAACGKSLAAFTAGKSLAAFAAIVAAAALLGLSACKEDCSAAARMGDFEASQGNWVNAVKQYERALRADAHCGVVGEKLAEAKRKVAAGK